MDSMDKVCSLFKEKNNKDLLKFFEKKGNEYVITNMYYQAKKNIDNDKVDKKLCEKIIKEIEDYYLKNFKGTITLTFGEVAEIHVGMQQLGTMADEGFSLEDLLYAQKFFSKKGCVVDIFHLNDFLPKSTKTFPEKEEKEYLDLAYNDKNYQAYVLIARNGLNCLLDSKDAEKSLVTEANIVPWDNKYYDKRRNKVLNKGARYNVNFDKHHQDADYLNGKGTTMSWDEVPYIYDVKKSLVQAFGQKAEELRCEGNKYYDPSGSGIGAHGDSERRKVIGARLGKKMNIFWYWHYNNSPRGKAVSFVLNPGDIYCMSEKTVGTDWRPSVKFGWKSKRYTLRHSAGAEKYTTKTEKLLLKNPLDYEKYKTWDIYHKPKKSQKNPNPEWTIAPN